LYLGNREEAYDAIQRSDSTAPSDLAAYCRAALTADDMSPDFGRISAFDVMPCAFWQGHDARSIRRRGRKALRHSLSGR
jgi:hypothetical protein